MSPGKSQTLSCLWIAAATAAILCIALPSPAEESIAQQPVFQVDAANPTADKPQSKLWFAQDSWWAWLPNRQGSSVWRRTSDGWRRAEALEESLRALPGRADVSCEGDTVRAVLVTGRRLAVVTLRYVKTTGSYVLVGQPARFELRESDSNDVIETATIARDGRGRCWIAYPWEQRMWVRATRDADQSEWIEPFAISEDADRDDLCAIVALPGGVGVAWSNQSNETMNFRLHKDEADAGTWEPTEEIERGNRNADDHINAKVTADGTLLLTTKNSVDQIGQPQLVLRVRHANGRWENLAYAPRTNAEEPSRPVILLGGDPAEVFLLHTLYGRAGDAQDKARRNTIAWQRTPLAHLNAEALDVPSRPLINSHSAVNNVTGCKAPLPSGHPWIVLASDSAGRVYEGRLDTASKPTTPPSTEP